MGPYLKDVILLAFSAFGGPQAHIAMLFQVMVEKKKYLTEEELIELNALCSILPGPTSTQTITAIGYKRGGIPLALLTLLIWVAPAATAMIGLALLYSQLQAANISLDFLKFLPAAAVGFIAYATIKISEKVVKGAQGWSLYVIATAITVFLSVYFSGQSFIAYCFPVLLIIGGFVSSITSPKADLAESRPKLEIKWSAFLLFGVGLMIALGGAYFTTLKSLELFESFYRNGTLVFGGGQVLIPLLQVEFVEAKGFLSDEQFLSGVGLVQAMPGPVFSMSGYIGAMSYQTSTVFDQIMGGIIGVLGIFLPGTFLLFFVVHFWEQLKKIKQVKNSLAGVNATAAGLVCAATIVLYLNSTPFDDISLTITNSLIVLATTGILMTGKIPAPLLIVIALAAGFIF